MTVTHCQALNGVGSAWNDLIHHNRFGNFWKSGCFWAEISERFKREQRRRSGPRTVVGMFRNKHSPDSHKRKRRTLVFLHSQTELPDVCLSMIHSLSFAPLCHVKSMLSREARVSHVGFGSALGNKWIILDALPYLCDWGARSLIFKKEIIAQHVINVTSEQWPALCITLLQASSCTSVISCGYLPPTQAVSDGLYGKSNPWHQKKNERAGVKNTREDWCAFHFLECWVLRSFGRSSNQTAEISSIIYTF